MWVVSHDFCYDAGGAERVTRLLAEAVGAESGTYLAGSERVVSATFPVGTPLRRLLPRVVTPSNFRVSSPLLAPAVRRTVISGNLLASTYAFAHWPRCEGRKVAYCHSPMRQLYSGRRTYAAQSASLAMGIATLGPILRRIDRAAVEEADVVVATCQNVASRISAFWGRTPEAVVLPPADPLFFEDRPRVAPEESLLFVGRLREPYKRVGLLLEAMRLLPEHRLRIVGSGPDELGLRRAAPRNVEFVGELDGPALRSEYDRAALLVFPSADDYGLVPLEAMACGTPVLAAPEGGALETITPSVTGEFCAAPVSAEALADAIPRALRRGWDRDDIRQRARDRFHPAAFKAEIGSLISALA